MTAGRRLRAFFQEESSESKSSGIEPPWQNDLMRKRKKSDEVTKQCTKKEDMVISITRQMQNILLIRWRRNVILIICQAVRLDFTLLKYGHNKVWEVKWNFKYLKKKILQRPRRVCAEYLITYLESQLWLCRCKILSPWKRFSLNISSLILFCLYCYLFCWPYSSVWQYIQLIVSHRNIVTMRLLLHLNYQKNLHIFILKFIY